MLRKSSEGEDALSSPTVRLPLTVTERTSLFARETASVSELLSLNGVVVTGMVDGKRKSVTAFYTYYNKK